MKYHQLTERERYTIAKMRMQHFSIAEIARVLGRHRSTIHREVKRNSTQMGDRRVYCWSKPTGTETASCDAAARDCTTMMGNTAGSSSCSSRIGAPSRSLAS